ncbi:MAG: aminoacetone oxidase family FAD-binding enzyme [Planctomycetota bacterium]|nr:aminoacetone oxidase family FAD-binding enzyme [Planctomycetota bacterium]
MNNSSPDIPTHPSADIAIIGAGAAGLFAAIWAAREGPALKVVAIDSARTLGAKILVAGGGRCNVTHHAVDERDYSGGSPELIRRILRRYPVESTIEFFAECGVQLKREETGKLFPTTDKARSVLDALVSAAHSAGVTILHPLRVESIAQVENGFEIHFGEECMHARTVILCMGGMSLPKSGSDGHGFTIARSLGHSVTQLIVPALVPLTLPSDHWLTTLSGLALPAELKAIRADGAQARSSAGKPIPPVCGAVLCAHFGLSGPAVLDVSRHWLHLLDVDPNARLRINWMPGLRSESLEQDFMQTKGQSVLSFLRGKLPERFLRAACLQAAVDPASGVQQLTRERRSSLVQILTACEVIPNGTRGFTAAETTAGGVPLAELNIDRLESLKCPRLFLCGEMIDVDGRIGGFSFQWAWASGFVAGTAAAHIANADSPIKS